MENNKENNVLKIIEWNIHRRRPEEEIKKIVDKISGEGDDSVKEADVIILTEASPHNSETIIKELKNKNEEKYFTADISNDGNYNNIVIVVSSDKIAAAEFEEFNESYLASQGLLDDEIRVPDYEKTSHPDRLLVRLKLKNGRNISILGIRMGTLTDGDIEILEKQFKALKWEIKESDPDIIIGDFNWKDAIARLGFNLNEIDSKGKYSLWPEEDNIDEISCICAGNPTAPDRVMWKKNNVFSKVSHSYLCGIKHKNGETLNLDEIKKKYLPSDHDILIVEVSL